MSTSISSTVETGGRIAVIAFLSACASLSTGCNPASEGQSGDTAAGIVATPSSSVVQVDDMIADLVDASDTSLTFKTGADSSKIAVGGLIASASPSAPFLRRVVDRIESDKGEVTFITTDVALDEAFSIVAAEVPGTFLSFTPAVDVSVIDESQSQRPIAGPRGKEIPVLNLNLSFKTNDNGAEASVGLKLDMTAIMELKASLVTGLQKLKVAMESNYEIEVALQYKAAKFLEQKKTLGTVLVIFWIGPVPIFTEISLVFELNGDFSGALAVSWTGGGQIGGQWTDQDGWSEIITQTLNVGTSKAQGKVNIEALLAAKWVVLKTLGPKLSFGPFVEGGLDALQPCDLGLEFGVKSQAALEFGASVINEDLNDEKAFAVERKNVLATRIFKLCNPGPNPPGSLTATATDGASPIRLTWSDNSTDETGFLLEWNTGDEWTSLVFLPADAKEYAHHSPAPGSDNLYRVMAIGEGGVPSEPSNVASVSLEPQDPPLGPSNLSATADRTATVALAWMDHSDNEDWFAVERAGEEGEFASIDTVGADVTGYADSTVDAGKTYRYRVQAMNESGGSAFSNVASVEVKKLVVKGGVPAAPSGLSAVMENDGNVTLTWSDNSSREKGFIVERSTAGGSFGTVIQTDADATGVSDPVPDSGETYLYRVQAFNDEGSSEYSNVASTESSPANPNDEVCALFGWCCADDRVCDSSWYACPEEDADCALCAINDDVCIESCLVGDPDCPSRELICGAIGVCCAGDDRCDIQCPLSDLDPDCTNEEYCASTGNCCDGDEICHSFCNRRDADCGPEDDGEQAGGEGIGGSDGTDDGSDNNGGTTCGTIRYAADVHSETIRVVSPDVDKVLGFFGQTDRIPICEPQTVQVFDAANNFVGSFFVPFHLVDVAPEETPLVFIFYQEGFGFGAVMEYLTLEAVDLTP